MQDALRHELELALGHDFADPALLRDALSHRSYAHEHPRLAPRDNERLEFLGDAVLGMAVAAQLYARFPDAPEGALTRRRAALVCERSLALVAQELKLDACLMLGRGEELSGGRHKPRLLASALEAVLGAVFVDAGCGPALGVIERLFGPRLEAARDQRADPKSLVQEWVQGRGMSTPTYRVVDATGADHERVFEVELLVDGAAFARGSGRSKMEAER
ncbi:MAG: ribonuclease III, partial [Deltaproteobacteria bacterium]|nr:ribonuclease III [Deltaproteobacteria bacterium]